MNKNTATGSSKVLNKEGGESFILNATEELVQIVTTNLFQEPKFYGDVQKSMDSAVEAVAKSDPEFILKLAAYCRNELYLRTVSIYLLVKAANMNECKPFVRKYTPKIVTRADELSEAIACHITVFAPEPVKTGQGTKHKDKKIPNSLKKGLADAFKSFDEYQFAKYNRDNAVKLKDVIMLTHAKDPSALIKKILDDKLAVPHTWETELSDKGNKAEVWHELIDREGSGSLPYMAMIRNINNLEKAKVDAAHFTKVCDKIKDPAAVRKSKQFPFRFYSVYKNVEIADAFKSKELKKALEAALNVSVENLPSLKGKTFITTDTSGSMGSFLSGKGSICHLEIGALMSAMANKFSENGIASVFGTEFTTVDLSGNILTDAKKIAKTDVGWSTNGYKAFEYLNDNNIEVDRILLFTDEELYGGSINSELQKYKKNINPDVKVYLVNLNGYGDSCLDYKDKNVVTVSGWSDKILQFIATYEEGKESFIKKISQYSA